MGALAEWGSSCLVFEKVVQKVYKSMQHRFMGLCGRRGNKYWTVTESECIEDAPEGKIHVGTREGVKQTIKQPTELVSNVTMKLVNLQATQGNDLAMRKQTDLMEEMQNQGLINVVGQRVDETYFIYNSVENGNSSSLLQDTMEQAVAKVLYPNGQPMFRVVRKPIECIPCTPAQPKPRLVYQPLPKTTWNRFNELEIKKMNDALQDFDPMPYERRMASKFYNNKGGLLTGAAGTGKTFLSDMLVEIIVEKSQRQRSFGQH